MDIKQPRLSHGAKIVTSQKAVSVYDNKTQMFIIIGYKLYDSTPQEEQTCQCGLKAS